MALLPFPPRPHRAQRRRYDYIMKEVKQNIGHVLTCSTNSLYLEPNDRRAHPR